MKKALLFFTLTIILSQLCFAAIIHGTVYDLYLKPIDDVIIEVNTTPRQVFIAKNSSYSFELPAGIYILDAEHYRGSELIFSAEEVVDIREQGEYNIDLILFPSIDDKTLDFPALETDEELEPGSRYPMLWAGFIAMLALVIILSVLIKKKPSVEEELDIEMDDLIMFLKQHKRTTQKDIRKRFLSSEAKISLMLSELEKKGSIEKIKKGRGNIIVWKR